MMGCILNDAIANLGFSRLTHTFNALSPQSTARYAVFSSIVKAAAKHGELKAVISQVPHLQQWAKDWGTAEADLWSLYVLMAEKCFSVGLYEEAHTVMVAHLNTKPAKKTGDVETLFLRSLCAGLIPSGIVDMSSLFVCPASAALMGTPAHKLLTAYVHGDLLGYKQVQSELVSILSKANFKSKVPSGEELQKMTLAKMRQLYLTTLPLGTPASLTMLVKDLGVSSTREVEAIVISAVNNGVITGKLDGVAKTLMLTSAFKLHFTIADWETLLSDLHSWKSGLKTVNKVIDQLRNVDDFDDDSDLDIDLGGLDGGYISIENRELLE
jgi:translation initiation factor 3 subunit M